MKYSIIFTTVIALALASQLVTAGTIAEDYGTPPNKILTVDMMDEIKAAVNDNDSRVGAIKTQTINLANGCLANEYLQAIATNGDLTCVQDRDTDTTYTAGTGITITDTTISIAPNTETDFYFITGSELQPLEDTTETEWHAYDIRGQYAFPINDRPHNVGHGVRLPDGATITEMRCGYYDNDPNFGIAKFDFNLYERSYSNPDTGTLITPPNDAPPTTALDASTEIRRLIESGLNHTVDNANNAYYMRLRMQASPGYTSLNSIGEENVGAGDSNIRTYGCQIAYQH